MSAGLWLALTASLGFAAMDGLRKHLVQRLSPITTAALLNGAQAVMLLGAALIEHGGVPQAPPTFYAIVLVTAAVNLVTTLMYLRAVQRSPLSLTIPYLAFTPALLLLTAWVVLGELPSARGVFGVLLVTLGAYVLPGVRAWRAPLAALAREPGSRAMLAIAFIWAVSSALDKRAVGWASPAYYGGLVFGLSAMVTLGYTALYERHQLRAAREQWPWLTAAAVGSAGALWSQYASYATLPVSYTIAIKRAGMLGSVLIGWRFFGEGELGPRLVGASIMLAGVLLIVLSPG